MLDVRTLVKIRPRVTGLVTRFFAPAILFTIQKKKCAAEMKMFVAKHMRQVQPVTEKVLYAEISASRQERAVIPDHAMIPDARRERLSVTYLPLIVGDVFRATWPVRTIRKRHPSNAIIKVADAEHHVLMTAFAKILSWKSARPQMRKQGKNIVFMDSL